MSTNPYFLSRGSHTRPEDGRCAMEWVAHIAGERHTDHPVCVSPFLRNFCIAFNDRLGDEDRQKLRPYLARCIGTADDGLDQERRLICREWLIREALPEWLDLAGRHEAAQRLRDLPGQLVDENVVRIIREARDEAQAARAETRKQIRARFGDAAAAAYADAAYDAYDADAAAAAAAADAAYAAAAATIDGIRKAVYDAVKAKVSERLQPIAARHNQAGFDLLERMLPKVAIDLPAEVEQRAREIGAVA